MCTVLDELISFVHLLRQVSCPYVLYFWYPYELYIRSCLQNTKLSLKGARNKVQGLSRDSPKHSWHLTMGWRSEAACKLWPCEQMWSTDHGAVTRTGTIEVNLTLAFTFCLKYSVTSANEWPCWRIFRLKKIFFSLFFWNRLTNVLVDARANIKHQTWTVGPFHERSSVNSGQIFDFSFSKETEASYWRRRDLPWINFENLEEE